MTPGSKGARLPEPTAKADMRRRSMPSRAAAPPPNFESPQTPRFSVPATRKPKPGCPKGKRKVKRHGKTSCVAKKQHKSKGKGKSRAAATTGRAGK